MNVSEYIVRYLEEEAKIDHAYVIVGGAALWICKALSQAKKLKFTFTNHEQAAVMSADGYARISGKPGVAFVTNGPALANAVTGMAQAYADSSPVVLFTGNSGLAHVQFEREHNMRQYGTQDVRTDLLMKPVTKKYYLIDDPAKTAEILADAFYTAAEGRPGPVCIEVPVSVQSMRCDCAFPPAKKEAGYPPIHPEVIENIVKQLKDAKRPLILAGQGVRLSNSTEIFNRLIELLDVPVVNSRMGIDTIETDSKYFVGRCGNHGSRASHFALQTCDVLLVLGSRLAPNTTGYNVKDFSRQSHKILVEIDPSELVQWGVSIDETIEGDLHDFLNQALALIEREKIRGDHARWVETCNEWKERWPIMQEKYYTKDVINSYLLVDTVTKHARPGDLMIADTGSSCSVTAQVWDVKKDQRVFISGGLSGMGYWATSMGLCEAYQNRGNVICFVGDGSLQMNIQEFATLHAYNMPVKLFVVTNDGYQFVRMSQSGYDIIPTFGTDKTDGVPIPDIEKVTKAYGLHYLSVSDPAKLDETVDAALHTEGPVVCEVFVTKDLNVEPRIKSIAAKDGTFIMPNYENLYPYLEEEVLKEEMEKAYRS